jgi:hypothetical protein
MKNQFTEKKLLRPSRFYDGTEETSEKLENAIGIEDECRDWYCAEHVMDRLHDGCLLAPV